VMLALYDHSMAGIWNVGTGRATTVNEVAHTLIAAFGGGRVIYQPARGEIRRSCLDVSKLTATGRWRPSRDLATGVAELAAFVKATRPL
jgi:UDP-glucose 4-epimerase